MPPAPFTQQDRAIALMRERGMLRASEFARAGVTAATLARMAESGAVRRLGRGLYQIPDAALDANHSLAEAAKLVPRGTICLVSALAFHDLTDTMPSRVWMAIGPKDRRPQNAAIEFVRFSGRHRTGGIERHVIEGVSVPIYSPAKTVVDLFRYRRRQGPRYRKSPGLALALEGLREALRQRKASPAEIARFARAGGAWKVIQPYLDAMTYSRF